MKKIPKDQVITYLTKDKKHVIISLYEKNGYRCWEMYELSKRPKIKGKKDAE